MGTGRIAALVAFLRVLWRAARQLFHEVAGAVFGLFSLYGVLAAWRAWHSSHGQWLVLLAAGYAAMMAAFAVISFRSARRIQ